MISNDNSSAEIRRIYRVSIGLIVVLMLMVSLAWTWFVLTPVPLAQPEMVIDGVEIQPGGFCPGDVLTYTYTVTVSRPGVYIFDASVWRVEPPRIILFNEALRMAAAHAETVHVVRNWSIPPTLGDALTDRITIWQPGDYERHIAITSSGRDTLPSIATIPFSIRDDCR